VTKDDVGSTAPPAAVDLPAGTPAECLAAVRRKGQEQGGSAASLFGPSDLETERALVYCVDRGASFCKASVVAQANVDRRAAVLRYLAKTMSSAEELALHRDRTNKLRHALQDPSLLADICGGDDDGDFVPNAADACPKTPPLTPTMADGCTLTTLPKAADRRQIDALLDAMHVVHDTHCDGSPVPAAPGHFGSDPMALLACTTPDGRHGLVITAVTNQTPDCSYFYDIRAHVTTTDGSSFDAYVAPTASSLKTLAGGSGYAYALLEFTPDDPGILGEWARADVATLTVSVRAMNGNGLASPWSAPRPLTVSGHTDCSVVIEGEL
jgi:hypothetical protein